MLTKTLIATVTAGVIGAASLGATTTSASAHQSYGPGYSGQNMYLKPAPYTGFAYGGWVGGPGWQLRFGDFKPFPKKQFKPVVQKVCGPTFETVQVWKPYQGWVWEKVYAGQSCRLEKIYPTKGQMMPHSKW